MSAAQFIKDHSAFVAGKDAVLVAAVCSSVSVLISLIHLYRHLRTYTMPQIQQWIVRIILVCPVYAISSSVALKLGPEGGTYVEFIRDLYEAFVVYSLLNLIMEYCGGEVDCIYSMEGEEPLTMPCPLNLCMKPKRRDAKLLRFCQRGVLQFVLVKPIMATCDVATMATGHYYNPIFQWTETVIYNISYCTALYCLLCIYLATNTQLKKFRCLWKISSVKLIILTAYYQELAVKFAPVTEEEAFLWKCLLLSVEMIVFSLLLAYVFPVSEFMGGIPDRRVLQNIKDVFALQDVVEGFVHNFKPAYRDYALQRSQSEAPATVSLKTFFVGNVDNVAMEMTERYRGRSSRMAFNSLLRGSRPISGHLRQPKHMQTPSPYIMRRRQRRLGLASPEEEDGGEDEEDGEGDGEGAEEGDEEEGLAGRYSEVDVLVHSATTAAAGGTPRTYNPVHSSSTHESDATDGGGMEFSNGHPGGMLRVTTGRSTCGGIGTGTTHSSAVTAGGIQFSSTTVTTGESVGGGASVLSSENDHTHNTHALLPLTPPRKRVPLLAPPRVAEPYVSPMSEVAAASASPQRSQHPPHMPPSKVGVPSERGAEEEEKEEGGAGPAADFGPAAQAQTFLTPAHTRGQEEVGRRLDDTLGTVELFEAEFEAGGIAFSSAEAEAGGQQEQEQGQGQVDSTPGSEAGW